jgi:tripeptidyl-peptidase-1
MAAINGMVIMERANLHKDNTTPQFHFASEKQPNPSTVIELIFSVKQNESKLQEVLQSVSDPKSSRYGKHLSKQEVDEVTANPEALEAIKVFLNAVDGVAVAEKGDKYRLAASATVSSWEKVLGTTFYNFEKTDSKGKRFLKNGLIFIQFPHVELQHLPLSCN